MLCKLNPVGLQIKSVRNRWAVFGGCCTFIATVIISAVWLISNFSVNALAIRIVKVSNGSYHSFGLTSDGRIYAWGRNTSGELGIGTTLARSNVPIAVKTTGTPMDGKVVKQVEGGGRYEGSHSIALASDGTVYTWGFNQYGQLGNNTTTNSRSPIAVQAAGTPLAGKTIVQIAAGANHNMVLTSDGAVYIWGWNYHGQLGNNTKTNSNTIVAVQTIGTPLAGKKIVKIAAGQGHSLALADDGTVYTWGRNDTGQLGNNTTTDAMLPVAVTVTGTPMSNKTIVEIASGARHSLAIDSSGKVYAWGHNGSGQLGNNSTVNALTPVAVQAPADKNIIQVSGSGWLGASSSALASDGTVYSWGRGFDGQLGDGTNNDSSVPVITTINLVDTPSTPTHVMAKPGDTTAIISWQAPIVSGGQNITGYVLQYQVIGASSWTTVNVVAAATSHTITGLTNDQTYRVRLAAKTTAGTGDFSNVVLVTPHAKPTITNVSPAIGPIAGGQNVTLTGANFVLKNKKIMQTVNGNGYSLALSADGTVYTWGRNEYGQLGNGVTATNSPVPVAVKTAGTPMDGKTIIQIHAGYEHSLALASDGTVYAWGRNNSGQLGKNDATDAHIPAAVQTLGTPMAGKVIVQLVAGNSQSMALASDGTVYTWGWNQYGQLGNNSTINSSLPVIVKTTGTPLAGKMITQIASGGSPNSLVLANDGTMYTWGWGQHGQLGNGTIGTDAKTPLAVSTAPPSALAPSAPKVTFDGIEATNVTIVNSTTITATTPAHAAGLVDVAIDLGDGDELYKTAKTSSYRYATVPDAPTNLATAPLDNAVRLTWTAPANNGGSPITDYVIQYSADGGITWSTYSHIASTSTTVTIPFLTPTTYTFRVAAVNAIGTGAYSATATGQIRYITLSAPTSVDIAVTPAGGTKMSSKSANVLVATNAATGYKLSLSTQSTNRNLTNGSQTIAPTAGTQTAPIALSGSAWGYRVNGIGNFGSTTTAENNVASSAYTWAGIPDHAAPHVIRTTTVANPTAETTAVWYGVSVTGSQQSGIYTATVTYTAINN